MLVLCQCITLFSVLHYLILSVLCLMCCFTTISHLGIIKYFQVQVENQVGVTHSIDLRKNKRQQPLNTLCSINVTSGKAGSSRLRDVHIREIWITVIACAYIKDGEIHCKIILRTKQSQTQPEKKMLGWRRLQHCLQRKKHEQER